MSLYGKLTACFLLAMIVFLCLTTTRALSVMDNEPVEHLKAHLPKKGDGMSNKLKAFLQLPKKEARLKAAEINKNLRTALNTEARVNVFLLHGSKVLAQRTAPEIQFNSTILLPHGVLLPILATTLPILLEGYKRELLHNSMGDVLKGNARSDADVKDYLSLSLHDLITKLPQSGGESVDFESSTLLSELNKRGKAALFYVNTVLENIAEDAWKDALISVTMDYSVFTDKRQMLTHFKDLGMYVDTLSNDLVNFYEVSKSDLYPLDGGHYLYGWWFNCPRSNTGSKCLAPFLPAASMAIFNRAIRIYSIPNLSLHLLIGNSGETAGTTHTIAEILKQDKLIWKAIYSVIDAASVSDKTVDDKGESKPTIQQDTNKEVPPTDPPKKSDQQESSTQVSPETPPSENNEKSTPPTQAPAPPPPTVSTPAVEEDEIVGDSMPKKKTDGSKSRTVEQKESSVRPDQEQEEDIIVEEIHKDVKGEREDEKEKTLLVYIIYTCWPFAVFLFYTILSHAWVYWIMHIIWYICSSLCSGVYLPRPKTAKQD